MRRLEAVAEDVELRSAGSLPSKDGSHSLYCAVIIKQVDEKTRGKVGLNELLRDI